MRPMPRTAALLAGAAVAAALGAAPPAAAITSGGTPTGEAYGSVGALVPYEGSPRITCSGTLIGPKVFLTAAHCGDALAYYNGNDSGRSLVTFAPEYVPGRTETIGGTLVRHPGWSSVSSSNLARNDVAVVLLDRAPAGVAPVQLVGAGGLDERELRGTTFRSVGYGYRELGVAQARSGINRREQAESSYQSLTQDFLRLSQVQATGDEGVCMGDSGGPQFDASGVQVSVTSTVDAMCRSYSSNQRLDLPEVRDFLDDHVALP